ncbi:MAG: hypothetical protein HWE39_05640 [Oceanospirillaceae bacterium]|nr:hypothetical protein [Oceanospirillaceae bacterium]
MRIQENAQYSYPVLREWPEDYKVGALSFDCDAEVDETDILFRCTTDIAQPEVKHLVHTGDFRFGVNLECQDTFLSTTIEIGDGITTFSFPKADLSGKVEVRGLIYATRNIENFSSEDFHEDYNKALFRIKKGEIVGFSGLKSFILPRPRISAEHLFQLVRATDPDFDPKSFKVSLAEDRKIQILAGTILHDHIEKNRGDGLGRLLNNSSVFSLALLDVLNMISGNEGAAEYGAKAWYATLEHTLETLGYDLKDDSLNSLEATQRVLQHPYLEISEHRKGVYA